MTLFFLLLKSNLQKNNSFSIIASPIQNKKRFAFYVLFHNYEYICNHNFADMVKLVDMPDLGSGAARRVGSSPIIRTKPLTVR